MFVCQGHRGHRVPAKVIWGSNSQHWHFSLESRGPPISVYYIRSRSLKDLSLVLYLGPLTNHCVLSGRHGSLSRVGQHCLQCGQHPSCWVRHRYYQYYIYVKWRKHWNSSLVIRSTNGVLTNVQYVEKKNCSEFKMCIIFIFLLKW